MTRLELERKLLAQKQYLSIAEAKDAPQEVIKLFRENIISSQDELSSKINRKNAPATEFMVEFENPYKKVHSSSSKGTYMESIREFGIENIKKAIPNFFSSQPKHMKENHFMRLEPNIYLYIQMPNKGKIKQLNSIALKIGRKITITLA